MVAFIDGYRRDGNGRLRGGSSIVFLALREPLCSAAFDVSHAVEWLSLAQHSSLRNRRRSSGGGVHHEQGFRTHRQEGAILRTRYRTGGYPAKQLTWPNTLGSQFSVFGGSGGLEHVAQEFVDGSGAQFGGDLAEALHDCIDRFIERGGAGSDADAAGVAEPRGIEFFRTLDLQCAQAA